MTNDTVAIRAQYSDGEYLDAYPGEACATILALCDALDDERAKCDEWVDRAMTELGNVLDLRADNELLRTALTKINVGDGWAAQIARAALAVMETSHAH